MNFNNVMHKPEATLIWKLNLFFFFVISKGISAVKEFSMIIKMAWTIDGMYTPHTWIHIRAQTQIENDWRKLARSVSARMNLAKITAIKATTIIC